MSKSNIHRLVAAVMAASLLAVPRSGSAADSEIEDLKREVRSLQAQVQTLRAALADAAELDRQKAALFTRALKDAAASPSARSEPAPIARAAPDSSMPPSRRPEPAAVHKSAPTPEAPTGTLRGNVSTPGGEPVAYVYVENVLAAPVKGQRVVIDQSGKRFMPGWAVIQRGTTIEFPNKDNIYHNVFSLSPGNAFDLGMYTAGAAGKAHTFMESGPVDVYCNIHPQMAASVLVVPNRYFAKVKPDGTFEISGVPSGHRKVVAWSPGSRPTVEWVEVSAGAAASVSFSLATKSATHTNKAGQAYGSYE